MIQTTNAKKRSLRRVTVLAGSILGLGGTISPMPDGIPRLKPKSSRFGVLDSFLVVDRSLTGDRHRPYVLNRLPLALGNFTALRGRPKPGPHHCQNGLADTVGRGQAGSEDLPTIVLVAAVTALIIFLTEITSDTATTAAFLLIVATVAVSTGALP